MGVTLSTAEGVEVPEAIQTRSREYHEIYCLLARADRPLTTSAIATLLDREMYRTRVRIYELAAMDDVDLEKKDDPRHGRRKLYFVDRDG